MKKSGRTQDAPEAGGAASWADETLPLGLRKELLARELQTAAARKRKEGPQSAASPPGLTERKVEGRVRERGG